MDLQIEPTEWEIVYPVHVEPIGRIRREQGGYAAMCGDEPLDVFPDGDSAAVAVWRRFIEQSASRHAHAAVTHGGADRHRTAAAG